MTIITTNGGDEIQPSLGGQNWICKHGENNNNNNNNNNGIDQVCCPWMAKTKSSCLKNNNQKKWKQKDLIAQ